MATTRKLFTAFMAFVLAFGLMPMPAFADEEESVEELESQVDEAGGADFSTANAIPADLGSISFVYVESPSVPANSVQNIVIGFDDEDLIVDQARLEVAGPEGSRIVEPLNDAVGGAALFAIDASGCQQGSYAIETLYYRVAGDEAVYSVSFTQDEEAAYGFEIGGATAAVADEDGLVVEAYTINSDGEYVQSDSIAEAMIEAGVDPTSGPSAAEDEDGETALTTQANDGFVIVLDPGHGGYDGGATGIGFQEKTVNLKIAEYCKAKLEQTPGVTVYMTRTNDTYVSLSDRVDFAVKHNADLVVSLHNNAGGGRGSEVIVPRNGSWYYEETYATGTELGRVILSKLNALGLSTHNGVYSRDCTTGETYPDGTLSDYYTLIDGPRSEGICGIIVEHAFVDNASDAAFLNNDESLKRLGEADAQAIIDYYNSSEGIARLYWGVYDYDYYLEHNADVKASYDSKVKAIGHFKSTGMSEGRRGNVLFDVSYYKANNADLQKAFGNNLPKYYDHFIEHGMKEGRRGSADFDPAYYKSAYSDLEAAFGNDWERYYKHYVQFGQKEGRAATGTLPSTVTVYRLYHKTDGEHLYTTSAHERKQILSWGGWNDEGVAWVVPRTSNTPVYRLYDLRTGEHHYTTDKHERDVILSWGHWRDEGIAWYSDDAKTLPVHRLQNSSKYPHAHHYTLSDKEKTTCVSKWGWKSEGVGWYALSATPASLSTAAVEDDSGNLETASSEEPADDETPAELQTAASSDSDASDSNVTVYRLYNTRDGEHLYTTSLKERSQIIGWGNWSDEGVAWVVPSKSNTPVYRLYDLRTGEHHYTTDAHEKDVLVSWGHWRDEGIAWYSDDAKTLPVHRLQNSSKYPHAHHYTLSDKEKTACVGEWGWKSEGVGWYALEVGPVDSVVAENDEAIMGTSQATVAQMVARYNSMGKPYPGSVYAKYGAATIDQFCQILYEEAVAEGVRAEVVFAQAMHETGWLQFGGDVKVEQCNFAGIGATGGGNPGNSFNDWGENSVRKGLRAQVQHLKAYASTDSLNSDQVDPRFSYVKRGCAPTVQDLGGKWAVGSGYGDALVAQIRALLKA